MEGGVVGRDITTALELFHAGHWAAAWPLLRALYSRRGTPDVVAALGICEFFAACPDDPNEAFGQDPGVASIPDLLDEGRPTDWPEVSACRIWLNLGKLPQTRGDEATVLLAELVSACCRSSRFPCWVLALRTLAWFDRRMEIRDLVTLLGKSDRPQHGGFPLVLAEARLESATELEGALTFLDAFDPEDCLPLAPKVASLWRDWLRAELAWWQDHPHPALLDMLQALVTTAATVQPSPDDRYSLAQWRRLSHRITLLRARYHASLGDKRLTRLWMQRLEASNPGIWDAEYVLGACAWVLGDEGDAVARFERSLAANPFQSRVRFEFGLLRTTEAALDSVECLLPPASGDDAMTSAAVSLARMGREVEAQQCLDQISRYSAPFSACLISPAGRALRLRQGRELRAHLAERRGDWGAAAGDWRAARATARSPATAQAERSLPGKWDHRAHEAYLLCRSASDANSGLRQGDVGGLTAECQKALGLLSIRPLLGDGMFYRALAAQGTMPTRSLADWRALLRQRKWVGAASTSNPAKLLCLGDRLLRAGFPQDAQEALAALRAADLPQYGKLLAISGILAAQPPSTEKLLACLGSWPVDGADGALGSYLRFLCYLAQEPTDCAAACTWLERAEHVGLDLQRFRIGRLLADLAARSPNTREKLRALLDEDSGPVLLPLLRLGFEAICGPPGPATLAACREAFGVDWNSCCPRSPDQILDERLRLEADEGRFENALAELLEGERLGCRVAADWRRFLHASLAAEAARQGNFDVAEARTKAALCVPSTVSDERNDDVNVF